MLYFIYDIHMLKSYLQQICPSAVCLGSAKLPGTRVAFVGFYTFAVITPQKIDTNDFVDGLLYELNKYEAKEFDKILSSQKGFMKKKCKVVIKRNNKEERASIFVYDGEKGREEMPMREYYEKLEMAYEEAGLNDKILEIALVRAFGKCFKSIAYKYRVTKKGGKNSGKSMG